MEQLTEIVSRLMAPKRGILAADESNHSADTRLEQYGIGGGEEGRQRFREFLFTTPGLGEYLSGVILYDETIRQAALDGKPFGSLLRTQGIILGIKVDKGKIPLPLFPGEEVTEGLDGLKERLEEYYTMGARFAKWRAVIRIGDTLPTEAAVAANAHALARFAALCQEACIVPMVEPEVLMEGTHTLARSEEVLVYTLEEVFRELKRYRVSFPGLILKTSMVIPGNEASEKTGPEIIGEATVRALTKAVPKDVGGVVFLSGGQEPEEATANLAAICLHETPWPMTFSFARALQAPALLVWQGKKEREQAGHEAFAERLRANVQALGLPVL